MSYTDMSMVEHRAIDYDQTEKIKLICLRNINRIIRGEGEPHMHIVL